MRDRSSAAATRQRGVESWASTTREATVSDAIDLDTDLVRLRRGPAEAEGVDALVAPRRQGDGGDLRDVERRDGLGLDLDGDETPGALEGGLEAAGRPPGVSPRRPAELAGEPRRQPDGDPGRGLVGAATTASIRTESIRAGVGRGPGGRRTARPARARAQAEPGGVAAVAADHGVEPEADRFGVGAGVGQVEDQPRALVGQVAEEGLVVAGVVGPPEHERSSASSSGRTAPGSRSTAFGPARSTIRSEQTCGRPGAGQVAERRDLGRDLRAGSSVRQQHDRPARVPRGHRVEHRLEPLPVGLSG